MQETSRKQQKIEVRHERNKWYTRKLGDELRKTTLESSEFPRNKRVNLMKNS